MCRVLEVSSSGFYDWLDRPPSSRDVVNEDLKTKVEESHRLSMGSYGRRRVAVDLARDGIKASPNRIERRMKEIGIQGYTPPSFKKTTLADANSANSPNLLRKSDSEINRLDQVWISDITYVATKEGWLYLCVFIDLFSRKVVGWAMDDNMRTDLIIRAFDMAWKIRKPGEGLIVHSDCGGQYKS